jgi:hypothetical protein
MQQIILKFNDKLTKYSIRRIIMLEFFKKLFGGKSVEATAPYKVEAPAPIAKATPAPKKVAKKPAVKKTTTRKPKA